MNADLMSRVCGNSRACVVNERPSKVQSSSVLLVKLEGTVLMYTLLGTVIMVLVAWTKFRYNIGSPSFGTKLVSTLEAIITQERRK